MKKLLFALCMFIASLVYSQQNISLIVPQSLLDTSITSITVKDVQSLFALACNCEVPINNTTANVQLLLPEIDAQNAAQPNRFAADAKFPYRNYPEHNFEWTSNTESGQLVLKLSATSWQGVSFGLYALLQEKLGFKFYHPRETIIPQWNSFPLQAGFSFSGKALFDKHGFHLHTQHPLELTEQLHSGKMENALDDVKEYVNWLVRNGQTYFEFCLLESIDKKEWINHAKEMVDYCHQRGIMASVDLSLHMIQQKTFQLYKTPAAKKKQVEKNLQWITQAKWDFINMEFSTAEFIAGNKKKKEELRLFIIDWLLKNSNTKLMGRQHVVKNENEDGHKRKDFEWTTEAERLDKERGVLSHTVMFYDMTEENAPVYENKSQRHMYDFLLQQMQQRETWYYPESAYWVTFDVSVPMLLLPYLSARLSDIDTCVVHKVPGHVTFSSGWEWGYWLVDWSIARWTWQYNTNGQEQRRFPTMYIQELFAGTTAPSFFEMQLQLQQYYLKDENLMQWMTAMTITDEIGIKALNDAYHPRPEHSYKFLQRKAGFELLGKIRSRDIPLLDSFYAQSYALLSWLQPKEGVAATLQDTVLNELTEGVLITALRAKHRSNVLQYILCKREAKLEKKKCDCKPWSENATSVRGAAQQIVSQRERYYRYPLPLIADKRWDHTSYHFGYLYPVSKLHFWNREEQQALKNKYSPLFMNIWNMFRIAGIID